MSEISRVRPGRCQISRVGSGRVGLGQGDSIRPARNDPAREISCFFAPLGVFVCWCIVFQSFFAPLSAISCSRFRLHRKALYVFQAFFAPQFSCSFSEYFLRLKVLRCFPGFFSRLEVLFWLPSIVLHLKVLFCSPNSFCTSGFYLVSKYVPPIRLISPL